MAKNSFKYKGTAIRFRFASDGRIWASWHGVHHACNGATTIAEAGPMMIAHLREVGY